MGSRTKGHNRHREEQKKANIGKGGRMKGKLKLVAKTGGIILDNVDGFINPTKEARNKIIENLEDIKKLKGKEVILETNDKNEYYTISPVVEEETIQDNNNLKLKVLRGSIKVLEDVYEEFSNKVTIKFSQSHIIQHSTGETELVLFVYYDGGLQ